MNQLRAIWAYRYFVISSIKTEFRSRFARSSLGGIWMILHPLAQVAIYALVLSAVLAAKLPGINSQYAYAIYLMAGILGWSLFAEVFGRSLGVFVDNGNLLKKMAFPKIALPLIVTGSALVNNFLLFGAILIVFGLLGHLPSLALLWLPLLLVTTLILALGLGLALGIINVFVRDIGQIVPILLQFWFWLTPVVYVSSLIPEKYHSVMMLNPMSGIVMGYQSILVYNKAPDMSMLIYPLTIACAALGLAFFMYFRANEEMADAL
ncbi:MAG: ABC transporter [Sulfuricurvum sp. MLSB]|uniref:ABC transporter permease n=1 Tax=unclassified Sulfuricurvum TaxID=2632390 RepID=UPI0005060A76|nr:MULTISPECIES: ABC transporter permease [unclassified Sulfuricurvum]KFN39354.1 MAG: ABC transporter [Sulfuricurvum sp. MLSB]